MRSINKYYRLIFIVSNLDIELPIKAHTNISVERVILIVSNSFAKQSDRNSPIRKSAKNASNTEKKPPGQLR